MNTGVDKNIPDQLLKKLTPLETCKYLSRFFQGDTFNKTILQFHSISLPSQSVKQI